MYTIRYFMLGVVLMSATLLQPVASAGATQARAVLPATLAQARQTDWRHLPYSSGLLFSRAVRLGLIRPASRPPALGVNPDLTCTPAPCVFPNVVARSGSQPVNETPIAANPKSPRQLLTAANDYNCSTLQGYYFSSNGGTTWSATCGTLVAGASGGDGDPIVGFDLNGVAYRGGIDAEGSASGVIVVDSSKNGTVWTTPVIAVQPYFSGGFTDKPWMQIDTSPASPHKNAIYVSTTQFDSASNTEITVSHSTDGGKTWKQTATGVKQNYPVINQFSDIATGKDGTVYLSFMRCTANGPTSDCGGTKAMMLLVKSTDGGNTWSKATLIAPANLAPDSCGAFYGCVPNTPERLSDIPAIAVDNSSAPTAGTLYAIDYSYSTYCQVEVVKSKNGGASWSAPRGIAPASDKHDQFFPWISTSLKGEVGATWLDRRNDPSNVSYEMFGGYSANGATFVNVQIGSTLSNPSNDGFGGGFMGDYTGNTFAGSSLYAAWTDTRSGLAVDEVGGVKP